MTLIKFYSLPFLDSDYQNVIDFENRTSQRNWFNDRIEFSIEGNIKNDSARTSVTVKRTYSFLNKFDYLSFTGDDGIEYYYFINSMDMINKSSTNIDLTLDVFNTYNSYITKHESFVDRCHVPRWNNGIPYFSLQEENLEMGDIVQQGEAEHIADFEDTVIVVSTVPIGKVPNVASGGGGNGNGTCWEDGKGSANGFRFIKGFEGFAPYAYQDVGGYWTIGYGVTLHGEPDIYNELYASQPVPEEKGAMVMFDLLTQRYGLPILDSVKNLGCDNQNQFDALLSLAYNSGNGSITSSNSLTQAIALNPNDEATIRPVWESFKITSGGVVYPGLVARRKEECNLYFGQDVDMRAISILNSSGNPSGNYVTENNGNGWLPPDCDGGGSNNGDYNGYRSFDNEFGKGWLTPVKGGTVTSKYGWRTHPISGETVFHHGTDIGVPLDTDYIASKDGTVTNQGYSSSMGNFIYIDHEGGFRTRVMHLNKILTHLKQNVKRGEIIGKAGTTGSSTGVHAHWEIRRISDNVSTDPAPPLQKGDTV